MHEMNLTQKDLSKLLDMTAPRLSEILNEKKEPTFSIIPIPRTSAILRIAESDGFPYTQKIAHFSVKTEKVIPITKKCAIFFTLTIRNSGRSN